jgi:hypothetical protein
MAAKILFENYAVGTEENTTANQDSRNLTNPKRYLINTSKSREYAKETTTDYIVKNTKPQVHNCNYILLEIISLFPFVGPDRVRK